MSNNKKFFISMLLLFILIMSGLIGVLNNFIEPWVQTKIVRFFDSSNILKPAPDDIALILIDDKTVSRIRMPMNRDYYAKVFNYLKGKAKVIAFDSIFISGNINEDKSFYEAVKSNDVVNSFDVLYEDSTTNTKDLPFMSEKDKSLLKSKMPIINDLRNEKTINDFGAFYGIRALGKKFCEYSKNFGQVVTPTETDGSIRAIYPAIPIFNTPPQNNSEDEPLTKSDFALSPYLGLSIYAKYKDCNTFNIDDNYLTGEGNCSDLKLPLRNLKMYLKWYKSLDTYTSHKSYSAIDVIDATTSKAPEKEFPNLYDTNGKSVFDGKMVILGAAAKTRTLEDIKTTPLIERTHAGTDIVATSMSNFLENQSSFLIPDWGIYVILSMAILFGIWAIFLPSVTLSMIALLTLSVLYLGISTTLFYFNIIVPMLSPIILIIVTASFGYINKFFTERNKKEQIQNAMGMYISKDVMKTVMKNIDRDTPKLGGKRSEITVLFSDIRGFTSISEKISAEAVTDILNEYFGAMEPIIRKHNGVLNKFIGDAILAIFGEPIQDKNHAKNAVLCAREMHEVMKKLQEKWANENKPRIDIGIAINTGEAFVGNIGSTERIEYTVIGDTVNTASRIESYNKVYKTRFLISESTFEKVNKICDVIKIREVSIRGKANKINIYEVIRVQKN